MDLKPEKVVQRMPDTQAHALAMSLPIARVVRELVEVLGASMVSIIGDVSETRAVTQWTDGRTPQRAHVLRFAFQLVSMMVSGENNDVVRAWFSGSNPHLNDRVPVLMLRDHPLSEIAAPMMAAARAFVAR